MRDRGKRELNAYNNNNMMNNGGGELCGEVFVGFPCKKHPASASASSGGICAYCLTDRLYQLTCPHCGELSCSCSNNDFSTTNNANSSSSADVGNVGRISFLLENDQKGHTAEHSSLNSKQKFDQRSASYHHVDDFPTFRRSNSTCVVDMNSSSNLRRETKEKFWKFGKLFRKKREKNNINQNNNNNNIDQENYECNGISRSRSVSSFRGFYDTEESGARASAARASSVSTGNFMLDSAKMSCFSESEARISNFDYFDASNFMGGGGGGGGSGIPNNKSNIFSLRETEFSSSDDPAYIDLKLHDLSSDNSSSRVPDLAAMKRSGLGLSTKEFGYRGSGDQYMGSYDMFRNGSCRRSSVTERELRKCRKSYKVWKWFFRHQNPSTKDNEDDHHPYNSLN